MNAVIHDMARGLDVRTGATVVDLARDRGAWQVKLGTGTSEGPFDAVVVTCPPAQAAALLVSSPSLVEETRTVRMEACWTVMAVFDESLELPFEAGFPVEGPLRWIARDSSKPGRASAEAWILHATPKWSAENIDRTPEEVVQTLLPAFFKGVSAKPRKPSLARAHRWRHAQPVAPLRRGSLWDPIVRLGACGDWCESGRVEGAYLSGLHLAERILGQHSSPKPK
jgi:predicted NAD/FAD-dependent oxidoreductase